jgi:sulfite exporter TauE/SafE
LPTLLVTGMFAHQVKVWIQKATVRNIAALLVIGFGVWTIAWVAYHRLYAHGGHQQHTSPQQEMSQPATDNSPGHQHMQH